MIGDLRVLCIIPARGGSRGIPLKNLRNVNGKSLVGRAIETAKKCSEVDRIVVSTDHPKIVEESKRYGAEVPFLRPPPLSGDRIGDFEVLQHALHESETFFKEKYDVVLMVQPTAPQRIPQDIKDCIKKLIHEKRDAVWTLSEADLNYHPLKQFVLNDGRMDYYDQAGRQVVARQQLVPVYFSNGCCYAFSRRCFTELKTILPVNSAAVVTERDIVDINNEKDLLQADQQLRALEGVGFLRKFRNFFFN
jgi:CMP-N,N'-diacetyllegionaminic acid synthase